MDLSKYIMTRSILKQKFNTKQWEQITRQTSTQFIHHQKCILKKLMRNLDQMKSYFSIFYNNHSLIQKWSTTQNPTKTNQIKYYIFKELLNQPSINYFEESKKKIEHNRSFYIKSHNKKSSHSKQSLHNTYNKSFDLNKIEGNALLQLFQFSKDIMEKQKWKRRNNLLQKAIKNSDDYEFYRNTFNACQGKKYISYDYQRHMKGQNMEHRYILPQRIVQLKRKALHNTNKSPIDISNQQRKQQSIKTIKTRQEFSVLQNRNKQNWISNMSKNKYKKYIILNHTGKPITYKRINQQQ